MYKFNPIPVDENTIEFFPNIQTLHLYSPADAYKLPAIIKKRKEMWDQKYQALLAEYDKKLEKGILTEEEYEIEVEGLKWENKYITSALSKEELDELAASDFEKELVELSLRMTLKEKTALQNHLTKIKEKRESINGDKSWRCQVFFFQIIVWFDWDESTYRLPFYIQNKDKAFVVFKNYIKNKSCIGNYTPCNVVVDDGNKRVDVTYKGDFQVFGQYPNLPEECFEPYLGGDEPGMENFLQPKYKIYIHVPKSVIIWMVSHKLYSQAN